VVLQLQVDATGAVTHAETSSTVNNTVAAVCVAKSARGWKFPARPNGPVATASYPFVFN
jgi:hypothetical protein